MAWVVTSAFSLVGATGCQVREVPEEEGPAPRTLVQAVGVDNGLSLNGLSLNGLSLNGLSLNGLSLNGLSTREFADWFNGNPGPHDQVMRYMVRCAVPEGETRDFLNPATGALHTWPGALGLTPDWAGGAPASQMEQQLISACLAAHANSYGLNVPFSLLGRDAGGANIPFDSSELSLYAEHESCFFGNVFTGEGLFAGNDRNSLSAAESTSRPCGLTGDGALSNDRCPELTRIGGCAEHCTLEPNGLYYTQCTVNGVQYQPLTTRLRSVDIHHCGDGICQQGERCGWDRIADSCLLDCGTCAL